MGDLSEVRFSFDLDGETVPGLLYLPSESENDDPMPLLLMQHPGMGSKDDYFVAELARLWARRGWVCMGLDAPRHGDRTDYDPMSLFRDKDAQPAIAAQFAKEASVAIDLVAEAFPVDLSRVGFVGYSLGSMLGVHVVGLDGRFRAAVFALAGEGGLAGSASDADSPVAKMGDVAVRVIGKLDDEVIPRESTEALYEALPGEKDIVWLPGGHFEIGLDVIKAANDWLVEKLK